MKQSTLSTWISKQTVFYSKCAHAFSKALFLIKHVLTRKPGLLDTNTESLVRI